MRITFALAFWFALPLSAQAPPTRTDNVKDVVHGVTIVDPYRWLENQDSPETRAWINTQNKYTRSVLDKAPGHNAVRSRLAELLKTDRVDVPVEAGARYFFLRRAAGQDQAVLMMRNGVDGSDEVLLDPNPLSPDHSTSVELKDVSVDGKLLAYGLRRGGEDESTVVLLDIVARKELPDRLPRGRYGISILPDHSGFFYSRYIPEVGFRVYRHSFGQPPAKDPVVFGEGYGIEYFISQQVSDDGRWLVIHVSHGAAEDKTEIWRQDLKSKGPIVPVVKGIDARFLESIGGNTLFVHTNWKAPNGRVLAIPLETPGREHWREVIPEAKDAIEFVSALGGRIVVRYLHNAASRASVFLPGGKPAGEIAFPEKLVSIGTLSGRWERPEVFVEYDSFHVPAHIVRWDLAKAVGTVWWQAKLPVDTSRLTADQVWYASKDGTRVPMFLVHRKDVTPNGSRPVLLTAYGGFNINLTPGFRPEYVIWAEHEGIVAIPNLRGGGEFGEAWHKAGMREKKQNVFDDFLAAAEWLIGNKYTNASKLAIEGGSNGGLLVGAAVTQRPDLFQAAVCGYPLLDMVRFHKFLVARWWVPEYGSSDDPKEFRYLYAYSPYHHVRKGAKYPAVLFVTGDSDTRVAPLHARKMAALMQASTGSTRPVLLRYDTEAGHSAGVPVSKQIDEGSDELSFLLWQVGAN